MARRLARHMGCSPGYSPRPRPSLTADGSFSAISVSSAKTVAAVTGINDRRTASRVFPCRAYGDPYLFVDRDVRGFARGTRS
jgi:hypothetical protein